MRKLALVLLVAVGATMLFPGDAHALFGKKRRAARSGEQTGNPYITGSGNITAPVLPPGLASGGPEQCVRGPDGRCLTHAQPAQQFQPTQQFQPAQQPGYYTAGPAPAGAQPYYVETAAPQLPVSAPSEISVEQALANEQRAYAEQAAAEQAVIAAQSQTARAATVEARALDKRSIVLGAVSQTQMSSTEEALQDIQARKAQLQRMFAPPPQPQPQPQPQTP